MHELSVAMSIVDVAMEEAERLGAPIVAVHVHLGPLSGVDKGALLSAYAAACEGSPLAGSRLIVRDMPICAWCSICDRLQTIGSVQAMCCPVCRTPTPDVRGGNELDVVGLEIADADANCRSSPEGVEAE